MAQYAKSTSVTPEKSRAEIERTLKRYGCDAFAFAWQGENAMIAFEAHGRQVKFMVPIPGRDEYTTTPGGQTRYDEGAIDKAWDQGIRQRWRALALAIKAKLEAVEAGIVSFEDEFLAHFVLPDGQTVGQAILPDLDRALERGLPPLLGSGS
jgi:hypothetical protein